MDDLEQIFREHPNTRERVVRKKVIGRLLQKKYPYEEDIIADVLTLDRRARLLQLNDPTIRGKDYDQKIALEQEAELRLGYEPSFHQNTKKLARIVGDKNDCEVL